MTDDKIALQIHAQSVAWSSDTNPNDPYDFPSVPQTVRPLGEESFNNTLGDRFFDTRPCSTPTPHHVRRIRPISHVQPIIMDLECELPVLANPANAPQAAPAIPRRYARPTNRNAAPTTPMPRERGRSVAMPREHGRSIAIPRVRGRSVAVPQERGRSTAMPQERGRSTAMPQEGRGRPKTRFEDTLRQYDPPTGRTPPVRLATMPITPKFQNIRKHACGHHHAPPNPRVSRAVQQQPATGAAGPSVWERLSKPKHATAKKAPQVRNASTTEPIVNRNGVAGVPAPNRRPA